MKKELLFISNSDTVTVVAESAVIDIVDNYASKYNGGYDFLTFRDDNLLIVTSLKDATAWTHKFIESLKDTTAWTHRFIERCIVDALNACYSHHHSTGSYRVKYSPEQLEKWLERNQ